MALLPRTSILARFSINVKNFSSSHLFLSDKVPDSALPKPLLTDIFGGSQQPTNGVIYDKKPFRMRLEKGKIYSWCLCGKSKSQPLCDGTHSLVMLKIPHKPMKFAVDETKDYWICNCKQTTHRPFCDGTHKKPEIQGAIKS